LLQDDDGSYDYPVLNEEECGRTTSVIGWCPLENVLKIRKIGMTKELS
jgi:hypothetical protein